MLRELIQETKDFIAAQGYTKEDIQWIGGNDFTIPLDNFWKSAPQYYNAGYGAQEVAADLKIVFKDGTWMMREEYDGSEWWAYRRCPSMPLRIENVTHFVSRDSGWDSLKRINNVK